MLKLFSVLTALLLIPSAALAGPDLSAMTLDELTQLRLAVDREIASRSGADDLTVTVDGVVFSFMLAEVGEARDGKPGLGVILLAGNPTDRSMTPLYDLGVTAVRGGVVLDTSWVKSEHFTSTSVSGSLNAVIRPGASGMQVCLGFILDGEGDVEITLFRKHIRAGEDPYCGTFFVSLPD